MLHGIQIWWLSRPLEKLEWLQFQSFLHPFTCVFWIIILLKHNIAWNQIVMHDCKPQEVFQNKIVHMLIHYTFNSMPSSKSKSCHTTPNHDMSTTMFHCLLDMLRLYKLSICYPTPWPTIKIKHVCLCLITGNNAFPIINGPICKPHPCLNMSFANDGFFYCTCAAKPSHHKTCLTVTSDTFFLDSFRISAATFDATPKRPSVSKVTHLRLSLIARCLGRPHFCPSSSPAIFFLSLTTQDWLIPIASATFCVELPFQSCSNVWSCCNTNERAIQKQLHKCSLLHNLQLQSITMQ